MSYTIHKNPDGSMTGTWEYYDLTSTLEQIFPRDYTKDSEGSYKSRVEMVSDLIKYCAKLLIEKELK